MDPHPERENPPRYLLGIVGHFLGGGEEEDAGGFVKKDFLVSFLNAAGDLVPGFGRGRGAYSQGWGTREGGFRGTIRWVGGSPNGIQQDINEEGVALRRDVAFCQEDFVVAALHQIL